MAKWTVELGVAVSWGGDGGEWHTELFTVEAPDNVADETLKDLAYGQLVREGKPDMVAHIWLYSYERQEAENESLL